jgi:hypothetical protein
MTLKKSLKSLLYLGACLGVPLIKGMEAPAQETIKKEQEEKGFLEQLPSELLTHLSYFLTSANSLDEAIQTIKHFSQIYPSILNNPETIGNFIEKLSAHFNKTCLEVAIVFNNLTGINWFGTPASVNWFKSYAQKNPQERKAAETYLLRAAKHNISSVVQFLAQAGINPNLIDEDNRNALMYAVFLDDTKAVLALIQANADINIQDEIGMTALMHPAENGYSEMLKILIQAGANLNFHDEDGNTALAIALENGHTEIVKLLQEAGAQK